MLRISAPARVSALDENRSLAIRSGLGLTPDRSRSGELTDKFMDAKEQFVEWLKDAYAMERALVDTLTKHAADAKDYPEIQKPIDEHREVTESHASQIEDLLEKLGEDKSGLKTALARFSGLVTGLPTSLASDTLVKNALAEFASENFEIACYTSLSAAASELGLDDAVEVFEDILAEEQEMADFLAASIPEITILQLSKADAS